MEINQEAAAKIINEKEKTHIFCTALVKKNDEFIEATTSIVFKKNGVEKLNTTQIITVQNNPSKPHM
jgi:hypothetical protein